jgi:hypothetical protein
LYSELAEQKAMIEKQNTLMLREMEMARHVQQALIPGEAPRIPGLQIALRYEPAMRPWQRVPVRPPCSKA